MKSITFKHNLLLIICLVISFHVEEIQAELTVEDIPRHVSFVVLNQINSYHQERSEEFRKHFNDQVADLENKPALHFLTEKWPDLIIRGGWTVLPVLRQIVEEGNAKSWYVFCEEETRINVNKLLTNLASFDETKEQFLGHGLRDKTRVIIHHFVQVEKRYNFSYPDFAAGFVLSYKTIQSAVKRMEDESSKSNFAIDVKHELAMYLHDDGTGVVLNDLPFFCTVDVTEECATWITAKFPDCGPAITDDDLFFAVKTCEQFHQTRLPIIKELWTSQVQHIELYSETADPSIPTVDLGVPNTERGHCGKLHAIIHNAYKSPAIKDKAWLVITDDDTLISVPRLKRLLACYDPTETVALGEKYGYMLSRGVGYDYITGGGGMVLSMETVRALVQCERCTCRGDDDPDDMMLGHWLRSLKIPVTHSPLFHQARVADYAVGYLSRQVPVSFHKFWSNDPVKDYKNFLEDREQLHEEL